MCSTVAPQHFKDSVHPHPCPAKADRLRVASLPEELSPPALSSGGRPNEDAAVAPQHRAKRDKWPTQPPFD